MITIALSLPQVIAWPWAVGAVATVLVLFCLPRLVPFYARQNWQLLTDPVEFEQPSGKVVSPFHSMVLPFDDRVWPGGAVKVGGLPW